MKKILFIGMTSTPGGMETYMINIFSKLEGHGFHFEFINMQNEPLAYSKFIRNKGGVIRNVFIRGSRFEHLTRKYKADNFFKNHHNYDIVHLNTTYLNQIYWIKSAKKYGINNLIIQSHNCGMDYKSLLFKILNNILASYNKLYLRYNSNIHKLAASKDCGRWMFGKSSNFEIMNNGINTKDYIYKPKYRKILKNKFHIPYNNKVIITTARLEHQKNYPKIIRVFNLIHKQNNLIDLVIVGTGSKLSSIKSMVHKYNLDKNVYFLGQQSKDFVAKLLNIADLMLMPSLYEAIPFSLTEAQSTGIPAIVSLNVIPKSANITGEVRYLSITLPDKIWAKEALNILNKSPYDYKKKIHMNKLVQLSPYSLDYLITQIKKYYLSL